MWFNFDSDFATDCDADDRGDRGDLGDDVWRPSPSTAHYKA